MPTSSAKLHTYIQQHSDPHFYEGYAFGFRQPTLLYTVLVHTGESAKIIELSLLLGKEFGIEFEPEHEPFEQAVAQLLMYWTRVILEKSEHPVFESARLQSSVNNLSETITIIQPCMDPHSTYSVVNFLIKTINTVLSGDHGLNTRSIEQIRSEINKLQKYIRPLGLHGFNQLFFLKTAFELGIPWLRLRETTFQLGFGSNARWLKSSITDTSPFLSVTLAKSKFATSKILRASGIPTPAQSLVKSKYNAVEIAQKMGYPVVIKPANLDGGKGVKANIHNADSVKKAFASAYKISKAVLVEKHVPGRDYRIHIVNGVVHGVLERIPGGVTGNGKDAVKTLLDQQNMERKTAQDDRRHLHQIKIDEEAEEQLKAQDLDWNSVPAEGRFIRLRGACNVTGGGIPVPIPLDQVHRDNLDLALRAARVLRLDVAGIDLLIPDIQKSWLESGAYVCEVNAQPQMHTDMHKPMLFSMFNGGNGRIPVAIEISEKTDYDGFGSMLHCTLLDKGVHAGLVCGEKVWIGNQPVSNCCSGSYSGAKMLCLDSTVEAMIISVTDDQVKQQGWPVDTCDVLFVNTDISQTAEQNQHYSPSEWAAFASHLHPELVFINGNDAEQVNNTLNTFPQDTDLRVFKTDKLGNLAEIVDTAVKKMLKNKKYE